MRWHGRLARENAMSLRYVVLYHTAHPTEPDHFDLMFETEEGSKLATFRSQNWPVTSPVARIACHRREYLEYEGEVSGGRGRVNRVAAGTFEFLTKRCSHWSMKLDDGRVVALSLKRPAAEAAPTRAVMANILGVDIGGTTVKLALVQTGEKHRILAGSSIDTLPSDAGANCVARIAAACRELLGSVGETAIGVGVGCPGLIDPARGVVVTSANLPRFENLPLAELLSKDLGLAVALQNDAKAATLGEFMFGTARGCRHMVLLTLGTGVGGGVISGGHLITGADNAATELGHTKVDFASTVRCGCGSYGCLETFVGMAGIARIARSTVAAAQATTLKDDLSTRAITAAANAGDAVARSILNRVGQYLGRGIANFIDIFNPERIVLAGGASRATPHLLPGIQESLEAFATFPFTRERLKIEATGMPDDINVLGAAAVYWNRVVDHSTGGSI